ncbi:MAG: lactate utilization protein [Saprospiraceae bacterium]|nr:lactate utilization protein [Saprospiraceae bacterium]
MEESTSREKVLKNVRNALISRAETSFLDIDFDSPIYPENNESLDILFAKELTNIAGKFIYCENKAELLSTLQLLIPTNNWKNIFVKEKILQELLSSGNIPFSSDENNFLKTNVGITNCEFLVARLGSAIVSSGMESGRRLNVFPEVHIIVAYSSQIVADVKEGLNLLKKKYNGKLPSMISVITGPSRTADIEKTLVMGAHGPKELYVFLIDDKN